MFAVKTRFHRFKAQHAVDAKMAADIAQKVEVIQPIQPFGIVEHERACALRCSRRIWRKDLFDSVDVVVDLCTGQQRALIGAKGGSPTFVVPPPISVIGLWPVFCSQRNIMIWISEPTCSDLAVASKPI